jgi:hypothetical protein
MLKRNPRISMSTDAPSGTSKPVRSEEVELETTPVSHGKKAEPTPATKKIAVFSEYCSAIANNKG